jgi:major membrane immunogen (membrane-anchored lipoprotein)
MNHYHREGIKARLIVGLIIAAVVYLVSCSKSDKTGITGTCYKCTTGYAANGEPPKVYDNVCTNKIDTVSFKDSNGNPVSFSCEPK